MRLRRFRRVIYILNHGILHRGYRAPSSMRIFPGFSWKIQKSIYWFYSYFRYPNCSHCRQAHRKVSSLSSPILSLNHYNEIDNAEHKLDPLCLSYGCSNTDTLRKCNWAIRTGLSLAFAHIFLFHSTTKTTPRTRQLELDLTLTTSFPSSANLKLDLSILEVFLEV